MKRFVVGVDGSAAAGQALCWAADLAAKVGAEIHAVYALDYPFEGVSEARRSEIIDERHELLEGHWIRRAEGSGSAIRPETIAGDARTVLLDVAEADGADLVVLGRTGGSGGPGFMHLGSVVEYVAHHARRPLAVIPPNVCDAVERIVLGVDGSDESLAAITWCAHLAAQADASVVAVSVAEPVFEWTSSSSSDNWRRDAERHLAEWTAPIADAGVDVQFVAQRDLHPADGLLGVTSARGGNVLVTGTRGAGGFTGLRAGGVAMKVLHRASVPLVLVPPVDEAP